jgi:hypothetical protein
MDQPEIHVAAQSFGGTGARVDVLDISFTRVMNPGDAARRVGRVRFDVPNPHMKRL